MIQLETLRLRAIEPEDASRYFDWVNDTETNQWRGLYPPTSHEAAQNWISDQMKQSSDKLGLALEIKSGGDNYKHIGFIGLRGVCARSRRGEMWIYLGDKESWSQGIGTQAVRGICQFAFEEMNLYRVWLECDPEHQGGVRCYQKVGFVEEGRLRQAYYRRGKFRDTIMMGLLRSDWEKLSEK